MIVQQRGVRFLGGQCLVGESPVWDAVARTAWWCDIDGGRIISSDLEGQAVTEHCFAEPVAAFGLLDSRMAIVAFRATIEVVDLETRCRSLVARAPLGSPTERFNDGKIGPDGAFWVGATDPRDNFARKSNLYRIAADGSIHMKQTGLGISNGLAWSPDGTIMIHADTLTGAVSRWRFDTATGAIGEMTPFALLDRETGLPDGGCFDCEGFYWSAGVTAGRLNRFDPDGVLERWVALPVEKPTSLCFVGDDLDRALVTSMCKPGSSNRDDGRTLVVDLGVQGIPQDTSLFTARWQFVSGGRT